MDTRYGYQVWIPGMDTRYFLYIFLRYFLCIFLTRKFLAKNINMESSNTSARPYACYSSLLEYGANRKFLPIRSPTPTTIVPAVFSVLKPHVIPQQVREGTCKTTCTGYRRYDELCPSCIPAYANNAYYSSA